MVEDIFESIEGVIKRVTYRNPENGYAVVLLDCDGSEVTAVGTIPLAAAGENLLLQGRWTNHATYGQQFKAEYVERSVPSARSDILAYLSSGAIRGIGAKTAESIVDMFGENSLDILENDPQRLTAIKGISADKARQFGRAFRRQAGLRLLSQMLSSHGLSPTLSVKLYSVYGESAGDAIRADPYILLYPQFAAPFGPVDDFALSLGLSETDPRRASGALLFVLRHNLSNGHVFLPRGKLITASSELIGVSQELISSCLDLLIENEYIMADDVAGEHACYLPSLYDAESYAAGRLLSMAGTIQPPPPGLSRMLEEIQTSLGIEYAKEQLDAIKAAAVSNVILITGGPGTGKTTAIKGIIELFRRMSMRVFLTAPTGRAAKRMSELTGYDAYTVHRLLQAQSGIGDETVFIKGSGNTLDADAVIMDETSMVDIELMAALLKALPEGCRMIMIGDPDQLPSVGPGRLLSDVIRSESINCVRLSRVFRQAQDSGIVKAAHGICSGEPPQRRMGSDLFILPRNDPEDAARTCVELFASRLPEKMGIPLQQIQLITPTRKGPCGSVMLNSMLRDALNPPSQGKAELRQPNSIFRVGDRVMQIRNNYDLIWLSDGPGIPGSGVFNGDIGTVKSIDLFSETVIVDFDDHCVEYTMDDLPDLEPAWAITVHKAQGSEFTAVVFAVCAVPKPLEIRSLFYTGVTRAKELLVIAGDERAIARMCENDKQRNRYSGLRARLAEGSL
ncbi:MAG: ATP-dependent RecD-like DNA helicase [Oscillospiraceae bacterium]|nr:ATP-dependent RecD-like DNA helicase [Oscillospiraceae bacterium]